MQDGNLNRSYTLRFARDYLKSASEDILSLEYKSQIESLYQEFISDSDSISVFSSGSTGEPKELKLKKQYMLNSAHMTCSYLKIPKGASTLLCMPLKFIGAKMVVIRALAEELELVAVNPSSHPLLGLRKAPYFAAMTPAQVFSSLESDAEREILFNIKELIIGGGAVNSSLKAQLMPSSNRIWSTYGMTETISHIALRRVNIEDSSDDKSNGYVPFEGVSLHKAQDGTLVIDAPYIGVKALKTNDVVEFNPDSSFNILGRADNIINSGGIKIQIEKLEELIREFLDCEFNVTSVESKKFGESVCLLIKNSPSTHQSMSDDAILRQIKDKVPKYWAPKVILRTAVLPRTESGKPARAKLKSLASELYQKKDIFTKGA
ncbi:O-succinylbenzoic acid--CoA ligase [Succinivibrio dextrinosolvens]|uniref:AMP-binding protein n=1 Tax=Succinivibrio dextrinosolvens TaxID=83771 RepID=UPI0008E8F3F6|nr:AMP-binding protein [Succinivibrio dextrinosolvens]SFS83579.1 O-succinylbenzoic acid--CoA ligase [Succinivibrio dextrinosolvens]